MSDPLGVGAVTAKEVYQDAIIAGTGLPSGSHMHMPVGVKAVAVDGHRITHKGTCVRKPLRSSVEEEAKYGKLEYITKDEPNSAEQLNRKQASLENQVATLQAEVKGLVSILQGKVQTEVPVKPIEVSAPQPVSEFQALRAEAKSKGINTFQMKKDDIIEALSGDSKTES